MRSVHRFTATAIALALTLFLVPSLAVADPPDFAAAFASAGTDVSPGIGVDRLVGVVAQASAPSLEVTVIPGPATLDPDDATGLVNALVAALGSGQWGLVAALGFVLLTYLARRFGGSVFPWLQTRTAGVLIPLLGSVALGIATALMGGLPITIGLVAQLVLVGFGGIGLFSGPKNIGQDMGLIAASHVRTKGDALRALAPQR